MNNHESAVTAIAKPSSANIGFIGAGNMATALAGGMITNGIAPKSIMLSGTNSDKLIGLSNKLGVGTTTSNIELIEKSDIVVLALKPQMMRSVIEPLAEIFQKKSVLIISVAAGITIDALDSWTGKSSAIIRCMPNTPALVQLGASGLFPNKRVNENQKQQAENILSTVGIVEWLENEAQIDAVTALSGSGPAYYFLMFEAMINAGKELGLSDQNAKALTLQTALGAATMAIESEFDVAELRRRVTSPNGTTEAAINNFQQNNLEHIVSQAMNAANTRSEELSKE